MQPKSNLACISLWQDISLWQVMLEKKHHYRFRGEFSGGKHNPGHHIKTQRSNTLLCVGTWNRRLMNLYFCLRTLWNQSIFENTVSVTSIVFWLAWTRCFPVSQIGGPCFLVLDPWWWVKQACEPYLRLCFRLPFLSCAREQPMQRALPKQRDVLPWDLLQLAQSGGLPCEAVVGVVICHDGWCADFAQFIFWALQSCSGSFQLLLLKVINWGMGDK